MVQGLSLVSEPTRRTPRQTPPMTPERLEQSGLNYLARFAASAAHLRRVLMRRVRLSEAVHATDTGVLAQAITALIERIRRGKGGEPAPARPAAQSHQGKASGKGHRRPRDRFGSRRRRGNRQRSCRSGGFCPTPPPRPLSPVGFADIVPAKGPWQSGPRRFRSPRRRDGLRRRKS